MATERIDSSAQRMADAQTSIGHVLVEGEGQRDAVHFALMPVMAACDLAPGKRVCLNDEGHAVLPAMLGGTREAQGIVDPFLQGHVWRGQRFWMFLMPNTITGLRHVWTHPSFPDETPKTEEDKFEAEARQKLRDIAVSEAWLQRFCDSADCPGYEAVMAALEGETVVADSDRGYEEDYSSRFDGEAIFFSGRDAHGEIPEEFWHHVEVVTGKKYAHEAETYFSCSC